jgi:hypothetical protein
MLTVTVNPPAAVITGWRLGGWKYQPRVEPGRPADSIFTTMANPPAQTGLRTYVNFPV